jgi:hypothetical protein
LLATGRTLGGVRPAGPLLLAAFLAVPAAAEVTVRVLPATATTASHVELTARAAPLAEVLDRLGRQIGMKVVYEGASPRQLVTLSLQGRSPAETVLALLEGQGLNFALMSDATGTRVETLLVAGLTPSSGSSAASASASSAGRSTPSPAFRRPLSPPGSGPDSMEEEPEDVEEELPDEPAPAEAAEAAGPADPAGANPVPIPQGPGAQQAAPGQSFPVSPFAPQVTPYSPQTFPPLPPGVPGGPTAPAPATPQPQPETPAQPPPG